MERAETLELRWSLISNSRPRELSGTLSGICIELIDADVCKAEKTFRPEPSKFGSGLCAYIIYLTIELRLSHHQVSDCLRTLFKIHLEAHSSSIGSNGALAGKIRSYLQKHPS